jgi:hypothetical protein
MLGMSYDIESTWGVSRGFFEIVTLGTLAFFILTGVVFWLIGKRNLTRGVVRDSDLLEIDGEAARATDGAMSATMTGPSLLEET